MMKRLGLALAILLLSLTAANAASRFGICATTCTWDGVSTTMWSTTSGGATGASVPGAADDVVFDANTCVGGTTCTITVNTTVTVNSITHGNCTASTTGCILDFSVNNNNVNLGFYQASGSGVRTLKMGNGTWTVTGAGTFWNIATATNFTFNAGGSNLVLQVNAAATATFTSVAGPVYNTVTVNPYLSSATAGVLIFATSSNFTITTLNVIAPNYVQLPFSPAALTVTNALHWIGSAANPIRLESSGGNQGLINVNSASTITYGNFFNVFSTGTITATNSFSDGRVSGGFVVTGPSGGGGACILGGWLLWRDITPDQHNNLPAFLDQAA